MLQVAASDPAVWKDKLLRDFAALVSRMFLKRTLCLAFKKETAALRRSQDFSLPLEPLFVKETYIQLFTAHLDRCRKARELRLVRIPLVLPSFSAKFSTPGFASFPNH